MAAVQAHQKMVQVGLIMTELYPAKVEMRLSENQNLSDVCEEIELKAQRLKRSILEWNAKRWPSKWSLSKADEEVYPSSFTGDSGKCQVRLYRYPVTVSQQISQQKHP